MNYLRGKSVSDAFASGYNNFHVMRLIAAIAVIYGHSYHITGKPGADFYQLYVGNKFIGGVAVDIFFIISGFLITSSLERSSIAKYIWSRCLRILPGLIVAVALCAFVLGPLVTTDSDYWSNSQVYRYFYRNALNISTEYGLPGVFTGKPDTGVNGSLWSLPVEFRLYFLFLAFAVIRLLGNRLVFTAFSVGLLAVGFYVVPRYPIFETYSNWVSTTAFFFAGALVWKWRDKVFLSPIVAVGLVAAIWLFRGTEYFTYLYFASLVYLVFFVGLTEQRKWIPHIKKRDLSYGAYLYGWPVQQMFSGMTPMWNTVASIAVALLLALMSWELIERPAMKLKNLVE